VEDVIRFTIMQIRQSARIMTVNEVGKWAIQVS